METVYKRILLKVSGEVLAGDGKKGIDFEKLNNSIDQLNKVIAPLAKLFSRD